MLEIILFQTTILTVNRRALRADEERKLKKFYWNSQLALNFNSKFDIIIERQEFHKILGIRQWLLANNQNSKFSFKIHRDRLFLSGN